MRRNQFALIWQFQHFANNRPYDSNDPDREGFTKLGESLICSFPVFKQPTLPRSTSPSMKSFYFGKVACHSNSIYIPSKRARFGIKSGYLWNSFVYLGKDYLNKDQNELRALKKQVGKTGTIVIYLMEDLLGFGFKLYVDNWHTSEALFRYLYENQTCQKNHLQIYTKFTERSKAESWRILFPKKRDMLRYVIKTRKKFTCFLPCIQQMS